MKAQAPPTKPCGRCGAGTDLEMHGHWVCFLCVRLWSAWLAQRPDVMAPTRGGRTPAGAHQRQWHDAYGEFLAEGLWQ